MTTKQIAEAAGVSVDTVQRKVKELYPDLVEKRRATNLPQNAAVKVMAEIRKLNFVSPIPRGGAPSMTADDRLARLETLMAAQIALTDRLINAMGGRVLEARPERKPALPPPPKKTILDLSYPIAHAEDMVAIIGRDAGWIVKQSRRLEIPDHGFELEDAYLLMCASKGLRPRTGSIYSQKNRERAIREHVRALSKPVEMV